MVQEQSRCAGGTDLPCSAASLQVGHIFPDGTQRQDLSRLSRATRSAEW